jgi:hypothetical protein
MLLVAPSGTTHEPRPEQSGVRQMLLALDIVLRAMGCWQRRDCKIFCQGTTMWRTEVLQMFRVSDSVLRNADVCHEIG